MAVYNLTYYLYGGINNPGNPDTYESTTDLPITLLDPTKEGYTFEGWYDNPDYIGNPITEITEEGDDVVYAKWSINSYTLEFTDHDGTVLQTADYEYGADLSAVTAPADPTRTGYTFNGWDTTVPATMPAENVTIQATYTINTYTLEFQDHDGTVLQTGTFEYGADTSTAAPADPTRTGYTFDSWDPSVPATMPASNTVITATYTINQYTITFDSNGGSAVTAITQDFGTSVSAPADPTKTNLAFDQWYSDAELTTPYTFTTMPAENITVYAQWEATVTFDSNGGSAVDSQIVNENNTADEPVAPTRTGYTFDDWYSDEALITPYDFATGSITEDTTLYAGWTVNTYTLQFLDHDGTVLQTSDHDYDEDLSGVTAPADPTRTGYTFDSWDGSIPATMPAEDVTINATYTINNYTVSFEVNGGTVVDPITGDYGEAEVEPEEPTRDGYTFNGWYEDDGAFTTPYVFDTFDQDITVYADWTLNTYDITYESTLGATNSNPATYDEEDAEIVLADPTDTGDNVFEGWYTAPVGGSEVTSIDPSSETARDITLYARWSRIGDFVSLPIYADPANYSYKVNRNLIAEVKPARYGDNNYYINITLSPGTLIRLNKLYTSYTDVLIAINDLLNRFSDSSITVDGGEV